MQFTGNQISVSDIVNLWDCQLFTDFWVVDIVNCIGEWKELAMKTSFLYLSNQTCLPLLTYSVEGQRQLDAHQIEGKRGTGVVKHLAKYVRQVQVSVL